VHRAKHLIMGRIFNHNGKNGVEHRRIENRVPSDCELVP
jgi:hypothetical protein